MLKIATSNFCVKCKETAAASSQKALEGRGGKKKKQIGQFVCARITERPFHFEDTDFQRFHFVRETRKPGSRRNGFRCLAISHFMTRQAKHDTTLIPFDPPNNGPRCPDVSLNDINGKRTRPLRSLYDASGGQQVG